MKKIKKMLKVIVRYIRNPKFIDYVDHYNSPYSIIVHENGMKNKDKIIYYIGLEKLEGMEAGMGFFALFNCVLNRLNYADRFGFVPYVHYPVNVLYHSNELDYITTNAFEYYFQPVSKLTIEDIEHSYNVIYSDEKDSQLNLHGLPGYQISEEGIENLAEVWKKYIKFNDVTAKMLRKDYGNLNLPKKVLGVHLRGTDFLKYNKNHPVGITFEEYFEEIDKIVHDYNFDRIFIATEDFLMIKRMKDIYGNKIIYYKDVLRTEDGKPVHKTQNQRDNHKYLLGYEVLRDMFTLSYCNSFIGGGSQVVIALKAFKKSRGEEFEHIKIIEKEIYR